MEKLRTKVIGESKNYASWFSELNDDDYDLMVFTGGEDVCPVVYDEPINPKTQYNANRDRIEIRNFYYALRNGIPMLGICRGSQLLCALSGGRLVQHQPNKPYHYMETHGGRYLVNSTHHQAQFPFNLPEKEYKIIGWTSLYNTHEDGNTEEMNPPKECEVVYYPKTKSLGVQFHPEMLDDTWKCRSLVKNLVSKLVDGRL